MTEQQPVLSIGLIVKNEEAHLETCLKALQPLRDQIPCQLVVADTGSEDRTRAIAEQYADTVFDFEWIDDFSAARNAVLEKCIGEWFMFVDADEYLDPNFPQLIQFLQSETRDEYQFALVCVRNYKGALYGDDYTDFYARRMTKLTEGVHFFGKIHEMLVGPRGKIMNLNQAVFHHDGYSAVNRERVLKKYERNMNLLSEELRRDPNNIMRILQCIESSREPNEGWRYAKRGLRVIREKKSKIPVVEPVLYRAALVNRLRADERDEAKKILQEDLERYPDSIYTRLDSNGAAIELYYQENEYEKALTHGRAWLKGLEALDAEDFDESELALSTLIYATVTNRNTLCAILFHCCCILKRWDEASEMLGRLNVEKLTPQNWSALIGNVFQYLCQFPDAPEQFQRIWDILEERASGGKDPIWTNHRNLFCTTMNAVLLPDNALCGAIAKTRGTPGQSVRILLSVSPEEIRSELDQVEDWDGLLYRAYLRVMKLKLDFPESFYAQGAEALARLAAALPQYDPEFTDIVLGLRSVYDAKQTPIRLTWILDLTMSAMRSELWEQAPRCQALCSQFRSLVQQYLTQIYNAALFDLPEESGILALSGMHRFGWYLIKAQNCLQSGDETGYVRLLRTGLKSAPAMKKMVNFMIKEIEQKQKVQSGVIPPELEELAEKIRGILSLYSPDDPAVQAIKQSQPYQKVAYYIEGLEAPVPGGVLQ